MIDDETLERVVEFHGHMCPGLAMGVHAADIALREIGPHAEDEEVVAVVENDMCAVDAIQFLTGCTFGKGNLIHRDWGKNAYTFYRRSDGRAIRVVARPDRWPRGPDRQAESRRVLDLPAEALFDVHEVTGPPPQHARIFATVGCAGCGEGAMETRIRRLDGRHLCLPCFEAALSGGDV